MITVGMDFADPSTAILSWRGEPGNHMMGCHAPRSELGVKAGQSSGKINAPPFLAGQSIAEKGQPPDLAPVKINAFIPFE